ncbi:Rpp14/Pop5 family protein [Candidatus Marsarchaeota archaeon]|nr:Rpp14/Pop5 family protein [Candidatus Marsarchaeota archaeon]MCL5404748.1 Rpp14/Pop5 family protein [Candidatus Marsarchaeota archaeon]
MISEKHRYLLVESTAQISGSSYDFEKKLKKAIIAVVGQLEYAEVNPRLLNIVDDRHFVVKCNLKGYKRLIVALALIKDMEGLSFGLYTLKSSGTLRALLKGFGTGMASG